MSTEGLSCEWCSVGVSVHVLASDTVFCVWSCFAGAPRSVYYRCDSTAGDDGHCVYGLCATVRINVILSAYRDY